VPDIVTPIELPLETVPPALTVPTCPFVSVWAPAVVPLVMVKSADSAGAAAVRMKAPSAVLLNSSREETCMLNDPLPATAWPPGGGMPCAQEWWPNGLAPMGSAQN